MEELKLDDEVLNELGYYKSNPDYRNNSINLFNKDGYRISSIEIPSNVTLYGVNYKITSMANGIFDWCTSLESIKIPESVKDIPEAAFEGCTSLKSINIPNGVNTIGRCAFENCSSLISVTIPNSVTSIGYQAFYRCKSLEHLKIPEGVTTIEVSTFEGCNSLYLELPDSVYRIGFRALLNVKLVYYAGSAPINELWGHKELINNKFKYNKRIALLKQQNQ